MLPEQQQRILGYFIEEARDHLNTIEQGLLNLEITLNDPEMVNEVFRAAHSIKGGAAMLGLSSIQHTSHRLEDSFKVLKDHPVKVDEKLESLFLGVSDTLKVLLEHLSGPFGLSEDAANNLMSETEPVFQWLNQHLELLVHQGSSSLESDNAITEIQPFPEDRVSTLTEIFFPRDINTPLEDTSKISTEVSVLSSPVTAKENNNWGDFQAQILQVLREMLQLFKQRATPQSRQNLQECCHQLVKCGQRWNLPNWCSLCQAAASAIANPENTYLTLAKIVITEIKQAQELILQGREAEIVISQQLETLQGLLEIDLMEISPYFFDEPPTVVTATTDNFAHDFKPTDSIHSLTELSEQLNPNKLTQAATFTNHFFGDENKGSFTNRSIDQNGPEVGLAELNTLADLFEGESSELDENWQQEEILNSNATSDLVRKFKDRKIEDVDHDLADFLSFDEDTSSDEHQINTTRTEDLSLLFGDAFLEKENSDLQILLSGGDSAASASQRSPVTDTTKSTDQEPLFIEEVTQIKTDGIEKIELSNEQKSSFEYLFQKPVNSPNNQTKIELISQPENLFSDNLFIDLEENLRLSTGESEISDLFDIPSTPAMEFSPIDDDLNNFWNQGTEAEQQQELDSQEKQDIGRVIEDSLFVNAASSELFDDIPKTNFDLEEFDINFHKQNLALPADTGNNLFEDLSATNLMLSPSLPDTYNFSQEPETLDLIPEFTNQPTEDYFIDFPQTFAELEVGLFDSFESNANDHQQFKLEEIATTDNPTYIQLENPIVDDLSITENTLDIDINLSAASDLQQLQIQSAVLSINAEITETRLNESLEPDLNDDLLFTDIELSAANLEELITTDDVNITELEVTSAAVAPDTDFHDEFSDLEALLTQEASTLAEEDFTALEALLGGDNDHDEEISHNQPPLLIESIYPQQFRPTAINHTVNSPVSSPNVKDDEFGDLEKLLAEADQTISHSSPVIKQPLSKISRSSTRRTARFEETMKVPVKQLDDMSNLVGELVVNRNALEDDHERLRQSLDNLLIQVQQLSDVGARMQELYERSLLEASLLASRKTKDMPVPTQDSNADRGFSELEMDRFTPFHTLSQEMIELIVRVRESASDIDFVTEETERVARQFRQVTTHLQEGLTRARMVPFGQTIDRLRRGVRDNAIKCGKQVELVIQGGDTLIDKMILDHLIDPLTHMLNNAIAHGIETPEERQALGKLPVGVINIRAFHQGNQTVISVGDDGAGIDSEKVKAKAIKLGMITADQAKTISPMEIYDLLFQSGFSIKDQADEISGRGVGMDVVRSEISEIRGLVNTDSTLGKGTLFTIRLPLTLSICKALCCVSDKARIAFPMDGVEDTLDIPVKNVQHNGDGQSFISWRDMVLPFRPLKELLTFNRQISRGGVYGGTRDDDMVSVVVVRSGNSLIALQIDQVLSEQEIVIKQFEGPAPKPIGVAGATVLGDGRVMPIADVLEILDIFQGRMSKHSGSSWQHKATPNVPEIPVPVKIDPTVLIVDDSITVRELLSLTFNKAGYRVEQARDGQEAWDKLRSGLPCDIVFCDIEMPRCDGLELLSRIQKDSNLNHLPIAMLTSRGADKHRQMAIQLGASGYFTKPYLEEALLEAASRMLKGEKLVNSITA